MPVVKHPAFDNVTEDVNSEDVAAWEEQGWIPVKSGETDPQGEPLDPRPAANASLEAWQEYARTQPGGDVLVTEGATRNDLRDRYTN